MDFTKIVKADLDSPCRELSNGDLGIVVALPVCSGNDFCVCVYWEANSDVIFCRYVCTYAVSSSLLNQTYELSIQDSDFNSVWFRNLVYCLISRDKQQRAHKINVEDY